jgi:antitoxin component YwqK of YwqJK toxin-antitoxin module
VEEILPEDLNSKTFIEYYENEKVKFEVSLKDGLKHGRYFQYDSLGNMIIKGRYRDDEKSGTWRYYDENGDLIKKERF